MKPFFLLLIAASLHTFTLRSQDRILWGDQNLDKIGIVNASNLGSETSLSSIQNPSGLAYYHANPTYPLFYASSAQIYRHDLGTTANLIITPTGQFNRGVAIDYVGKKIYWANSQEGYIARANLDGSEKDESFITGLNNPWDIEIDPVNQKIYWTEDHAEGEITRANLSDGSNAETLIHDVNSLGLAVDPLRGKLYYTKFPDGTAHAANIDGSGSITITGIASVADIDVDVATGMIYTIDYGSNPLTKADPDGSNKTTINVRGTFITYGDVTPPIVSSIARHNPTLVNVGQSGTAVFRVTFSEPVLNVDATDFEIDGTPAGTLSVAHVSLNTIFDVSISGVTGTGTLGLDLAASQDIFDFRGNAFTGTVTAEQTYTVISATAPVVTSFNPTTGPIGAIVTITGSGFSATHGDNTVLFNGIIAPVTGSTTTSITAAVPAGATDGPIVVAVDGLTATSNEDFVICTAPDKPTISRVGNVLTSSADTGNQWLHDYLEIPGATVATYTALEPGDYTVKVTVGGCSASSDPTNVTGEMLTPVIDGFTPASGPTGTLVEITGTTFGATPLENVVKFNGVTAVISSSTSTSITATVPAGAGTGPISVTYNGRTGTSATNFTFICVNPPKPVITHDGGLLTSSSNTGNQWFRNGAAIPGATNKTYTAIQAGAYSVIVTIDGCSTESDPTTMVGTGETSHSSVQVYPNPTTGVVNIEWQTADAETKVEVYSMTGQKKKAMIIPATRTELDIQDYSEGMYMIVVTTGGTQVRKKLWKIE
jgi:hypothetical protein